MGTQVAWHKWRRCGHWEIQKLYNEYQARIEDGIPANYEKSFGDICQAYKDQLLELKTRVGCTNLFNSYKLNDKW